MSEVLINIKSSITKKVESFLNRESVLLDRSWLQAIVFRRWFEPYNGLYWLLAKKPRDNSEAQKVGKYIFQAIFRDVQL